MSAKRIIVGKTPRYSFNYSSYHNHSTHPVIQNTKLVRSEMIITLFKKLNFFCVYALLFIPVACPCASIP